MTQCRDCFWLRPARIGEPEGWGMCELFGDPVKLEDSCNSGAADLPDSNETAP